MPDYSSNFKVENYLSVGLTYVSCNVKDGSWEGEVPWNIPAGETKFIKLKDDFGFTGSEAEIRYSVDGDEFHPDHRPIIKMYMKCVYYNSESDQHWADAAVEWEPKELFDIKVDKPPSWGVNPIWGNFYIRYRENVPLNVQLDSISLQDPLFPVLNEQGYSPDFALQHPLWSSKEMHVAKPATFSLGTAGVITLHGEVDAKLCNVNLEIIGTSTSSPSFTLVSPLCPEATTGKFSVDVFLVITGINYSVPWGFRDTINWHIRPKCSTQKLLLTSTPLEFYAISPNLHPFLAIAGVPVHLLRFIVLPTRSQNPPVTDFVRYATRRIHSESGFKYDPFAGAISYAGLTPGGSADPGSFQLTKWLKNQQAIGKEPKREYHVNCYDQAGILGICLGFCFSGDMANEEGLRCFLVEPFGYVQGDLVGWGYMNSPFFRDKEENKVITPQDEKNGKKRSGFTRHVFLTWRGKVLDATCGPHLGDETLMEYLETAIDHNMPGAATFDSIYLHTPMTTLKGVWGGEQTDVQTVGDLEPDLEDKFENLAMSYTYEPHLVAYFNPDLLLGSLGETLKGKYEVDGKLSHAEINNYPNPGHYLSWNMTMKPAGAKAGANVDLEAIVEVSDFNAARAFRRIIRRSNYTKELVLQETSSQRKYLIMKGETSSHAIWVYGNICMHIKARGLGDKALVPVIDTIQSFLEKEQKQKHEAEVAEVSNPVVDKKKQECLKPGDTIEVEISVKGARDFTWDYRYGNVVVRSVDKPDGLSGKYKFHLYARRPGFERVVFTFTDEFYRSTTKVIYVNVVN